MLAIAESQADVKVAPRAVYGTKSAPITQTLTAIRTERDLINIAVDEGGRITLYLLFVGARSGAS